MKHFIVRSKPCNILDGIEKISDNFFLDLVGFGFRPTTK